MAFQSRLFLFNLAQAGFITCRQRGLESRNMTDGNGKEELR